MPLEQAIQDHAAAIRELAAAIRGGAAPRTADQHLATAAAHVTEANKVIEKAKSTSGEAQGKSEAKKADTKKPDPKQEPVEAPVEEQSAATLEEKDEPAVAEVEVTRDQVRDITLALGKAGKRDPLVALLGELGVAKSSQLEDNQLVEFFTRATALLGE